jgi:hypothetical protein
VLRGTASLAGCTSQQISRAGKDQFGTVKMVFARVKRCLFRWIASDNSHPVEVEDAPAS